MLLSRSVLQSDGTYVTSSYIHLTASRWDHGQEVRCEASNEVLEKLQLQPQEAVKVLDVRFAPILSPLTLDPVTGNSSDEVKINFVSSHPSHCNVFQVTLAYKYLVNPPEILGYDWRLNGTRKVALL